MKRVIETVLGAILVLAGSYVGVVSGPTVVALVFVGVGGFFVSKSLMIEAITTTFEAIRND